MSLNLLLNTPRRNIIPSFILPAIAVTLIALSLLSLSSCSRYPTQTSRSVDARPSISFSTPQNSSYEFFVDGTFMGKTSDFITGQAKLMLTQGSHILKIVKGGIVIQENKVYLSDDVEKTIILP